jgi:uncharacterized membrane protein
MKWLVLAGRKAFGICLIGVGAQHLFYRNFDPVFLPDASSWLPFQAPLAIFWGLILILAGLGILLEKKAKEISLVLGGVFFAFFLFCHVPYQIFYSAHGNNLGYWTKALKELAFSGGAFAIAGSYSDGASKNSSLVLAFLEKFIPFGAAFFSITMICFGIDHFNGPEYIAALVPEWIPYRTFWAYFTGAALICSGVAIIIKFKLKLAANLLGAMIFIWFIVLHIPRAIAEPFENRGNEVTSVFQSFGFSGVAFIIAGASVFRQKYF